MEVQKATTDIRAAAAEGTLTLPSGLLFILYGSKWVRADGQQLYCFPVSCSAQGYQQLWQQEIESSTVTELVQRAITQS